MKSLLSMIRRWKFWVLAILFVFATWARIYAIEYWFGELGPSEKSNLKMATSVVLFAIFALIWEWTERRRTRSPAD